MTIIQSGVDSVAEALRELAGEVEALEGVECEECAKREFTDAGAEAWWFQDAYERLVEKLADVKRGICTLDEVFEEADV
jgi:hypothetical protein